MSNTEDKKQDKSEEANTAPYLKKNIKSDTAATESSKGNFIIPIVLVLVSAIVIVATFYEDEYSDLMTAGSETLDNVEEAVENLAESTDNAIQAATEAATSEAVTNEAITEEKAVEIVAVATTDTAEKIETAQTDLAEVVSDTAKSAAAAEPAQSTVAANQQKPETFNRVRMHPAYATAQQHRPMGYQQAREQAMQRAQAQAKKHNEMLQQRRAAYEAEMQSRRQQYEARMKSYNEQRAKAAEAQKAIYQRVQQNRVETAQKLKDLHEQISEIHNQIHQIMQQPYKASEIKAEKI